MPQTLWCQCHLHNSFSNSALESAKWRSNCPPQRRWEAHTSPQRPTAASWLSHSNYSLRWRPWILLPTPPRLSEQQPGHHNRTFPEQPPEANARTERLLSSVPRSRPVLHSLNDLSWWVRTHHKGRLQPPFSTTRVLSHPWIISGARWHTRSIISVRLRTLRRRLFARLFRAGTRRRAITLGQTSRTPLAPCSKSAALVACRSSPKFIRGSDATKDTIRSTEWAWNPHLNTTRLNQIWYTLMRQWPIRINPAFNRVILITATACTIIIINAPRLLVRTEERHCMRKTTLFKKIAGIRKNQRPHKSPWDSTQFNKVNLLRLHRAVRYSYSRSGVRLTFTAMVRQKRKTTRPFIKYRPQKCK